MPKEYEYTEEKKIIERFEGGGEAKKNKSINITVRSSQKVDQEQSVGRSVLLDVSILWATL